MDFSATTQPGAFQTGEDLQELGPAEAKTSWILFGGLVLLLTYCYLNMLTYASVSWMNPLYSHGYLVPAFAAFLFYVRFKPLKRVELSERWIGVAIIAASLGVRLFASYVDMNPLDRLSYVVALIGICQLVGGWEMVKWAGPAVGFLIFMFSLPSVLEHSVLLFLQRLAAKSSTLVLQLIGAPALQDGNRIIIDQVPLEVADACSGLRMSTIFGAMSLAMAILIKRPWWDRLAILLSALPIAIITNVIRITITALIYMVFPDSELIHKAVHDWAGLAMMPIALGLLWIELQILELITVPIESDDYMAFGTAQA